MRRTLPFLTEPDAPATDITALYHGRHRLSFRADGTIEPVEMRVVDNFCDGNAYGFRTFDGTWSVQDEHYEVEAPSEGKSLLNTNFGALAFEAQVTVGPSGDAGLLFRARDVASGADAYRGYYAGIDAEHGRVILGKADLGTWTELGSTAHAIEAGKAYHLKVIAKQTKLEVYLDEGVLPVVSANDNSHAEGATGLRAHGASARFDDLSVATPRAAIFYADGGFGGAGVALDPGSYTQAQLSAAGIANDGMSSLRVPSGFTVKVFADDNFGGASWTFTEDTPLVPEAANDQMSSVQIVGP